MDYGITALDPTVGLLRKELEVNNVPPGQEADYFQAKGRPLSPQLVFLIQANKQLQESAQSMQARPPQGTVADDLSAALVQKANQGMANLMQPRVPMRTQGVAGLPAGNVGSERAYAGGGIVAFSEGGKSKRVETPLTAPYPTGGGIDGILQLIEEGVPALYRNTYGRIYNAGKRTGREFIENLPGQRLPYGVGPTPEEIDRARKEGRFNWLTGTSAKTPGINSDAPTYSANPPFDMRDHIAAVGPDVSEESEEAATPAGFLRTSSGGGGASARASTSGKTPSSPYDEYIKAYVDEQKRRVNETPEEYAARMAARDQSSGLAAVVQARKERLAARLKEIEDDESKSKAEKKRDMLYQLAAAGFGSVGKGRNVLEGLGLIGANFSKGAIDVEAQHKAAAKQRKKDRAGIEDAQDASDEGEALRRRGYLDKGDASREAASKALYEVGVDARKFEMDNKELEVALRREAQAARIKPLEQMQQYIFDLGVARERALAQNTAAGRKLAARLKAQIERVNEIYTPIAAPGQGISADARLQDSRMEMLQKDPEYIRKSSMLFAAETALNKATSEADRQAKQAIVDKIKADMEAIRSRILSGGNGAPSSIARGMGGASLGVFNWDGSN